MHPKVLSKEAWGLVRRLARDRVTDGWILAGGTGLAVQYGHRYSEDLDFFTVDRFDATALIVRLAEIASVKVQHRAEGTLHTSLGSLRTSFLHAQAPMLYPGTPSRGIVLADPRDIAVMKIVAAGGRGSRKDFIDLHFFLRNGGSLEGALSDLRRRFTKVDYNEYHLLKSLVYFEDAETEPMPHMIRESTWEEVKNDLVAAVRRLSP